MGEEEEGITEGGRERAGEREIVREGGREGINQTGWAKGGESEGGHGGLQREENKG